MSGSPLGRRPLLVLVTAHRWLHTVHLALAARDAGFEVALVGPAGHPVARLAWVTTPGLFAPLRRARSVARALDRVGDGAAVVPVDDVAEAAVVDAYRRGLLGSRAAAAVARSLGSPETFGRRSSRVATTAVARDAGVDVPPTLGLASADRLEAALHEVGLPAVLKTDGSWAGQGVLVVHDVAEAREAWARLSRRPSLPRGVVRWWRDDDASYVADPRTLPRVSVQAFVPGTPATVSVACWEGEVLGEVALRVVPTAGFGSGPATVVEPVEPGELGEAARAVVKALGLSGLCGLDFHARPDGGASFLELNPRATPTAHLPTGDGRCLLDLLAPHFGAVPAADGRRAAAPVPPIALYPQERVRDASSPWVETVHEDVPAHAPDAVAVVAHALGTPVPSPRARLERLRRARAGLDRARQG
ncbi:ATP-grasp domain-containing protein [Luteimicrobium sp. NPDC057192]|uniref:ATP-grasp domain-containing protein n=1 Tax=Luteimicrobium sp. NPDC057192 TaxID=3346042 RepID=UPI00362AD51C